MPAVRALRVVVAAGVGLLMVFAAPRRGEAQRVDLIRGRVIATDSTPLENAIVTVRDSAPGGAPHQTRTDAKGAYSVSVTDGTGVYMIAAQMLGHAPQRRVVHRPAGDSAFAPVDFRLAPAATQLGAVRSVGERPKTVRSDMQADQSIGGQTQFTSLSNGLTGDMTGDLTAALTGVAGVTFIPDPTGGKPTVSAFGVSGDQNGTVLNGMGFGGTTPRDGVRAGAVISSYDPSRGFFAGIQQTLRLNQGSNVMGRSNHTSLDEPWLQYTTPVAERLGTQYGQIVSSGNVSGPIVLDKLWSSTNYQVQRHTSDLTSLSSIDSAGLDALRLSSDSVARLLGAVLPTTTIPERTGAVPPGHQNSVLTLTERVDFNPTPVQNNLQPGAIIFGGPGSTNDAYYMQFGGTLNQTDGSGITSTTAPAAGTKQTHQDGWAQVTAAKYLPYNVLNETTIGVSGGENHGSPYLDLPSARVGIESPLSDGTTGITNVTVGGSSSPQNDQKNWATQLRNQTSWNTWDRRHSVALTLDGTQDGYWYHQDAGYGTYAYNTLADFANNTPASYSRTLTDRQSSGQGFTGAIGLGDTYNMNLTNNPAAATNQSAPSKPTFQYGVRLEGNHFDVHPAYNPAVDSAFGLRTDHVPNTLALTPMVGFNLPLFPEYKSQGINVGRRGNLSGGVREYRGVLPTRSIDNYARQTGLPDAVQQLYCVGAAVPTPEWPLWTETPDSVPTSCANGTTGTPLAQTAPNVQVFAPNYTLFQSWRPALQFRYIVSDKVNLSLNGNYAMNQHTPGTVDVNFNDVQQFTLSNEDNRPVYVPASSIIPSTGVPAWTGSRLSPAFAHVNETVSDLAGRNASVGGTLNFSPGFIFFGGPNSTFWNFALNYSYNDSRQEFHGFTSTSGDPTQLFWARGSQARHVITLTANLNNGAWGSISMLGRIQSGLAYTPSVFGDINGDGNNNDRAFIFDPASPKTDSAVAAGMSQLLANAPATARACLLRQMGAVAGMNSCTGPWMFTNLSLRLTPDSYKFGFRNRGSVSLYVNNILSGLDQALHGPNNLHGWGQYAYPDGNLLTVRGFNPATNNFVYTVNPLFGSSTAYVNAYRRPLTITLDATIQVEPDRESQFLSNALHPRDTTKEMSWQQIKTKIMNQNNPIDRLILVKDSLKLDSTQVQKMKTIGQHLSAYRDSVATDIAKYLYSRHGDYGTEEVRHRWHEAAVATYEQYYQALIDFVNLLTPAQRELSMRVPQTLGIVLQASSMKPSDVPITFRFPMSSLP